VRGIGFPPMTAASVSLICMGFMNAALAFFAGFADFFAAFLAIGHAPQKRTIVGLS
jgi:hypothetical protein